MAFVNPNSVATRSGLCVDDLIDPETTNPWPGLYLREKRRRLAKSEATQQQKEDK